MRHLNEKKTKIRRFSSALIAKLEEGLPLNCQALRDHRERLTDPPSQSVISQDELNSSEEAGENYYTHSLGKSEAFAMRIVPINLNSKASIKDKARLNIYIAKDLADSFGGRKADYLIRLNRKLRMKIAIGSTNFTDCLSMAA
jgi:hypothetical protein